MRPFTAATSLHRTLRVHHATGIAVGMLAIRLYLAFVWWQMGTTKIAQGWLTSNPLRTLLELVRDGKMPTTAPGYAWVAELLLATRADQLMALTLPLLEVGIALALATGLGVRVAATLGIVLNVNLILAGLAGWQYDGRIIALQLVLLAAGPASQMLRFTIVRPSVPPGTVLAWCPSRRR
jgi:uncharacterized membrane protein YphA (DoxX/SURF4 family)